MVTGPGAQGHRQGGEERQEVLSGMMEARPNTESKQPFLRGEMRRLLHWGAGASLLFALAGAYGPAPWSSDLVWLEEDWSAGHYESAEGLDPESVPSEVIPLQDPSRMLFVAEPTTYQGIYALGVYHDTLFLGAGPYPLVSLGAEILTFDLRTWEFSLSYEPEEESILRFYTYGDTLYVPGPDTEGGWTYGSCVYMYDGTGWTAKRSVETAIHVFDLVAIGDTIYVTTGDSDLLGRVWRSTDWCDTFTPIFSLPREGNPFRRIYAAGVYHGDLYVQPDQLAPEQNVLYRLHAGQWDTLSVPELPADNLGRFVNWGDSLVLLSKNRMLIFDGEQWQARWIPFSGNRWCGGIHLYKGDLYGGAEESELFRCRSGEVWHSLGQIGLDPDVEEIEALATCEGRLFVATSWPDTSGHGRLYVSASAMSGSLISLPHDFGTAVSGATIGWQASIPAPECSLAVRVRSAQTLAELYESPFVGPDGTEASAFAESGSALGAWHEGNRWFQYRVDLMSESGLRMAVLEALWIQADSLDPQAAPPLPAGTETVLEVCPNPALSFARIRLPRIEGAATLGIYDALGRLVTSRRFVGIVGRPEWVWDLTDWQGNPVAPGTYFVWLHAEGKRRLNRLTVLR